MTRVAVRPEMLLWACERAGRDVAHFVERMPQLGAWVRRERQPTLKQLEKLARATLTPLGYLFPSEPPKERLPVPDYRTLAGPARDRPSPDLLDTLYTMQRRQAWLRESLTETDAEPLAFVGSARAWTFRDGRSNLPHRFGLAHHGEETRSDFATASGRTSVPAIPAPPQGEPGLPCDR